MASSDTPRKESLDSIFTDTLEINQAHLARDLADAVMNRLEYIRSNQTQDDDALKECDFLSSELETWELLDTLEKSNNSRPIIEQLAAIKAWLEKSAAKSQNDSNSSFKRESLFGSHHSTSLGFQFDTQDEFERPTRRRRIYVEDEHSTDPIESLHQSIYQSLRYGELDRAIQLSEAKDEPWRTLLLKRHIENYKNIRDGRPIVITAEERKAWMHTCQEILSQNDMKPFGIALYALFCGDVEKILPCCETWEDVLWAYYAARIESELVDAIHSTKHLNASHQVLLTAKFVDTASAKDSGVSIIFHLFQSSILTRNYDELFSTIEEIAFGTLPVAMSIRSDSTLQHFLLRFSATLAIYLKRVKEIQTTTAADGIIETFAMQNGLVPHFHPRTLGYYASNLPEERQIRVVSRFLFEFDGDRDEKTILIEMGQELGLNMQAILKQVFKDTIVQFHDSYLDAEVQQAHESRRGHKDRAIEFSGYLSQTSGLCLSGLEWLTFDIQLCQTLVIEANSLIRVFLWLGYMDVVNAILRAVPSDRVDSCVVQTSGALVLPDYLAEFSGHQALVECLEMYQNWERLYAAEPTDNGDFESLERIQQWKDGLESLTERLDSRMYDLLTSNWLRDGCPEQGPFNGQVLRQMYIPELVVQLHTILFETRNLISGNLAKCIQLARLVASEKHALYRDIAEANKMKFILEHIQKSQTTALLT